MMDYIIIIDDYFNKLACVDLETLLIGIGLPIAIVIFQLYLRAKDKRTTSITFIENKTLNLSPVLIKELEGLSIKYENAPIEGNIIFYQFTITNSGISDIQKISVYEPLCLRLPDNYIWKSAELFSISENLKLDVNFDSNELTINWDLFKKGEYARLNAVIEYQGSHQKESEDLMYIGSMMSKITFTKSRIADLIVSKTSIRKYDIFLRNAKTLNCCFFSALILTSLLNRYDTEIVYQINSTEGVNKVEIKAENKTVLIRDVESNQILDSLSTFIVENIEIAKTEKLKNDDRYLQLMLISAHFWGLILLEQRRMRRKRKRLGLVSDKHWNQFEIEDC